MDKGTNHSFDTTKDKSKGLSGTRYFICFVLSNLPLIYLVYYTITVFASFHNNQHHISLSTQPTLEHRTSLMDPQNVALFYSYFTSIFKCGKNSFQISLRQFTTLLNFVVFYGASYYLLKYLSVLLHDTTCSSTQSSYKGMSSFSFTMTYFFLVFCHLLSSSDSTITRSRSVSFNYATPVFPPAPFFFILPSFDRGNQTHQQVYYGVLYAYIMIFSFDFIQFYCRPFYNTTLLVGVCFILSHYCLKDVILSSTYITWYHIICVINTVISYFTYRKNHLKT
ncbi:Uncharacterized protein QTN25_003550 [Entamoeba marina]